MRKPDFIIGPASNPYLLRWFLVPRNRFFNIYLHKFIRDDDDRALHDHPWWFMSLILIEGYYEVVPHSPRPEGLHSSVLWPELASRERGQYSLAFYRAEHRHRVVLRRDEFGRPVPCWTLVITGPRVREWGFWCPRGFVHWKKFTQTGNHGQVGKGCEE